MHNQKLYNFDGLKMKLKFLSILIIFLSFYASPSSSFSKTISQDEIGSLILDGKNYLKDGKFELAVQSFEECLALVLARGDKELQMECRINLGLLYWNLDEVEKSTELYSRALLIATELNLPKAIKICESSRDINNLVLKGKKIPINKPQESRKIFQKAIDLANDISSQAHELRCLRYLSQSYFYSEGPEYLDLNVQALEIAQILNHKLETMKLFNYIAGYHTMKHNYAFALANYFDALKIARNLNLKDKIQTYSNNLVSIYLIFGDFQKSYKYLIDALNYAKEEKNNTKIAAILTNFGRHYETKAGVTKNNSDYSKALEYYKDSLHFYEIAGIRDLKIPVLNNIGNIYAALKNYPEALHYFRLCLEEVENGEKNQIFGMLLTNIGEIQFELQNYKEAEIQYLQALQFGEGLNSSSILYRANFGLAKTNEKLKKYDLAISYYLKAIEEIEQVRSRLVLDTFKSGYTFSKRDVFEHLLNLYFFLYSQESESRYGFEMFLISEKRKANSFLENLEDSDISVSEEISAEYEERELEITNRIATLLEQLPLGDNASEGEAKRREEELLQAEDDLTLLLNQMLLEKVNISKVISPKPFNLNYLQDRYLDPKTVLIEYSLGEDQSFVFFVSKNIFKIIELPSHSEIKDSIKFYLKALRDPSQEIYIIQKSSRRLYLELFASLDEFIPADVTNLIIIPDGILYYLPFETLLSSFQDKVDEKNYLISRFAISYMPSASSLLFLDNKKTRKSFPKELLMFGDPDYSIKSSPRMKNQQNPMKMLYEIYENQGYKFSSLPYSKKEINKISRYFPKEKTDIYFGRNASENTIKQLPLEDYRVLHFACHSFLDETFPMRSALVLSPDEDFKEDGFLKVREIYNFDINSELVVLSACSTGQGKMEGSDGVLGLPRIFFYAGAKSVVSTLWGINDKSTVDFMNYFYQGLYEGKSKVQALRLAKIRMLKSKYSHPYYWGAFILNGDYRSTITSH